MSIETEMEKMMTTATKMTKMTPEAGQSTGRRAPGPCSIICYQSVGL